jgi:hypothetical protein
MCKRLGPWPNPALGPIRGPRPGAPVALVPPLWVYTSARGLDTALGPTRERGTRPSARSARGTGTSSMGVRQCPGARSAALGPGRPWHWYFLYGCTPVPGGLTRPLARSIRGGRVLRGPRPGAQAACPPRVPCVQRTATLTTAGGLATLNYSALGPLARKHGFVQ